MSSPEEILMFMVYNQDYDAVQTMLKSNINVNFQNSDGITPLLGATEKGDYRISKLLLDHGADCNGRGRLTEWHYAMGIPRQDKVLEWTPLINAALYGHPHILQLLIDYGADINFRDINGRSALSAALQQNKQKCAEILIRSGAEVTPVDLVTSSFMCPKIDIRNLSKEREKQKKSEIKKQDVPLLHPAAFDGDREGLRDLIKRGADINLKDKSGNTALHIAIENGYLGCAELLINKGADVNIQCKNKSTALHIAASLGATKIIPCLVEKGAVVDAKGDDEITPLHFAVFHTFPLCVKQLLNFGASVNATFADGKTALHVAVSKSSECIELLMKENADIFAKDDLGVCPLELAVELGLDTFKKLFLGKYNVVSADGTTPLHVAARCCKIDCLQLMIEEGCDVNVVNDRGDTPLHFACSGGGIVRSVHGSGSSKDLLNIELLIKAGADINKKNSMYMSPVHVCAKSGSISTLKVLSKFGATLNSQGGDKEQTPLHFAAETGNLLCIKYLIEKGVDKMAVNADNSTALMLAAKNTHFPCVKFLLENDVPLWRT